ncbi:MAG: STELLO glycosyltransferase family protein [Verrucomicrobiota bacterium JB024]|nr:STELLO glycosyltransferase family protein [Verrucomicrobiota bacterium JB024]
MSSNTVAVITTIQSPTPSVRSLCQHLAQEAVPLIVIGDRKGPSAYETDGAELFTLAAQQALPLTLARGLPEGSYSRKNLGYLLAMRRGASCIYETDDDNAPNKQWVLRAETVRAARVEASGWLNVYAHFTPENVWPRGLPLDAIRRPIPSPGPVRDILAPIQQGLADGSPDVDAVWRLAMDRDIRFEQARSICLPPGTWSPFNSQSTWWWPSAYPLMYLPSHCSFRMTDIWRSFIAQRCLWEFAEGLVFHPAEVDQERNAHDLMRDFADEVPGYLQNARIADILESLPLQSGPEHVGDNLLACYEALVSQGILPEKELELVRAWLADIESVTRP